MNRWLRHAGVAVAVVLACGAGVRMALNADAPATADVAPAAVTPGPVATRAAASFAVAADVGAVPPLPTELARRIGDASDVLRAVRAALQSNDPDAMRVALDAVLICAGMAKMHEAPPVAGAITAAADLQSRALTEAKSRCAGFVGLARGDLAHLRGDLERGAAAGRTVLAKLDELLSAQDRRPLDAADKSFVMESLRSGDAVIANRSARIIATKLSDATDPAERIDVPFAALLGEATQEAYGLRTLYPTDRLEFVAMCVYGLACERADGTLQGLVPNDSPPEADRVRRAFVDALRANSFDQLVAVHARKPVLSVKAAGGSAGS